MQKNSIPIGLNIARRPIWYRLSLFCRDEPYTVDDEYDKLSITDRSFEVLFVKSF